VPLGVTNGHQIGAGLDEDALLDALGSARCAMPSLGLPVTQRDIFVLLTWLNVYLRGGVLRRYSSSRSILHRATKSGSQRCFFG
jgi:hypothetical protein